MGPETDCKAGPGTSARQEAAAADSAAEQQGAFRQHWLSLTFSGRCGLGRRTGRWGVGVAGAITI